MGHVLVGNQLRIDNVKEIAAINGLVPLLEIGFHIGRIAAVGLLG